MPNALIISQQGIDIKNAADTQKVVDSRWEYMNIFKEDVGKAVQTLSSAGVFVFPLVEHNIGFLPAFTVQLNGWIGLDSDDISTRFYSDTNKTYMLIQYTQATTSTIDITASVTVRIFNCDITKPYKALIQEAKPEVAGSKSRYGLRILSDKGASLKSTDLQDYNVNTDAKSMSIQEHGVVTPSGGVINIEHNFGVPPAFAVARYYPNGVAFGIYGYPLGGVPLIATINSTEGIGTVDGHNLTLRGAQYAIQPTDLYAYILYKDPLETAL